MSKSYKISVLDQSPVHGGTDMQQAVQHSVELAKACDELGYYRYWFSEQHAMSGFVGCAPEILMANLSGQTRNIRLGSGSILLNHYSPYKVAETAATLSALSPGRIDLALGRDLGPHSHCIEALAYPHPAPTKDQYYEKKLQLLCDYFEHKINIAPLDESIQTPEFWISGTKEFSANLAAQKGLGYVHGIFPGSSFRDPTITQNYRSNFKASSFQKEPNVILAFDVVCAETTEDAKRLVYSDAMLTVNLVNHPGELSFVLEDPETINPDQLLNSEKEVFDKVMNDTVYGTVEECKNKIESLVQAYQADEVMVLNNSYSFKQRLKSFKLLSKLFS